MKAPLIVFALLLTCSVAPASAQSLFIDGTIFAGIERRPHAAVVESGFDSGIAGGADLNGTVAGGGVTIGTWLTPHVTARLEVALPGSVTDSQDFSDVIQITPIQSIAFTQSIEASEQLRSAAALVGYHTERRHGIQLGYLGGAAFVFARERFKMTSAYPMITLPTPVTVSTLPVTVLRVPPRTIESTTTSYGVTAEAGLDVDISLGRHLSVVPQVRAIGFGNGISIRPGVAMRAQW